MKTLLCLVQLITGTVGISNQIAQIFVNLEPDQ